MDLRRALAEIVGDAHAFDDPDQTASYEEDWTGRFRGRARVVVRPRDHDDVADIVELCAEEEAAIVPQGGNTGLVGASVPRGGEVVLSLTRLDGLGAYDPALGLIRAGAGVTLGALAAAVPDPGLDFGARDTATLGGIVACNAGGARALRHGTARARVAGLRAVLSDGTSVTRLSGLLKDNAGYDLPSLLVGSEGTLGIITEVLWRTVPRLPERVTALIGVESVAEATELLASLRGPDLEACDFFTRACVGDMQIEAPLYLLAEWRATEDPTHQVAELLGDREVLVGDERMWALREGIPERIQRLGVPVKLDVGVPLARLAEFLAGVGDVCGDAQPFLFGHLGDGNVHVNLVGDAPDEEGVVGFALALGGTLSAEHGVGVAKARWLELARGPAEFAALRAIKDALDPQGILNPGVVLP
jgi:FAD/FMN-containing dehydrogenase